MKTPDEWDQLYKVLDDMLSGKRGRILSEEEVALNDALKPDSESEPDWVAQARKQAVLERQKRAEQLSYNMATRGKPFRSGRTKNTR